MAMPRGPGSQRIQSLHGRRRGRRYEEHVARVFEPYEVPAIGRGEVHGRWWIGEPTPTKTPKFDDGGRVPS